MGKYKPKQSYTHDTGFCSSEDAPSSNARLDIPEGHYSPVYCCLFFQSQCASGEAIHLHLHLGWFAVMIPAGLEKQIKIALT